MKKIKHTIRDLIINLISWSGLAFVYRMYMRRKGPLVRVLCFHDVADRAWFASILDMLSDRYHVVSPEQFANKEFAEDQINILITFDDGYQSWVAHAAPELEARGMRGLFFVSSGLLDTVDTATFYQEHMLISPKAPLTWEGARRLTAASHTIGSHTVHHARMSQLPPDQTQEEVLQDKTRLEEMLDTTIDFFAYPFGTRTDYTKEVIELVNKTGIQYQFSAISAFAQKDHSTHTIPRTLIENNQSLPSIQKWVEGGYDLFHFLKL